MLIDPDRLAEAFGSGDFDEGDEEIRPNSREDEDRRDFLRRYVTRGLFRSHLITDAATDARLAAPRAEAPNGAAVVDIIRRAALLSWHARTPLRTPPILVLGPPGTGKSRLARRLAQALGTSLTTIDGGTTTDRGLIAGHEVGYRGSGPGKVARALLDGQTAGPVLLLDEVDKISSYGSVQPLDALLGVIEPTSAARFVDTYVDLPMRADGVIWILTANAIDRLPAPLLDRVVVVEMLRLGKGESRAALQRLLAELLAEHGLPPADFGASALGRLQTVGLRQARRTLALALGPAIAAGVAARDRRRTAAASESVGGVDRRPVDQRPGRNRRAGRAVALRRPGRTNPASTPAPAGRARTPQRARGAADRRAWVGGTGSAEPSRAEGGWSVIERSRTGRGPRWSEGGRNGA